MVAFDELVVVPEDTFKIIIDEEFKSLIPVLSPEEKSQLEQNLLSEGCRDPIFPLSEWGQPSFCT